VDAQQTRSAQDAPGNNQAATTHMPSSLTFVMERAGLPNASVLASNKLANPECGENSEEMSTHTLWAAKDGGVVSRQNYLNSGGLLDTNLFLQRPLAFMCASRASIR